LRAGLESEPDRDIDEPMHILCVSPDVAPYGESPAAIVSAGLGKALRQLKHDVTMLSPLYPTIDPQRLSLAKRLDSLHVSMGKHQCDFAVYDGRHSSGVQTIFLDNHQLFNKVYQPAQDSDEENILRFVLFSAAASIWLKDRRDTFDLMHAHDWSCALSVLNAKHSNPPLPVIYNIYDLQHQGRLPETMLTDLGLNNEPFAKDIVYGGALNLFAGALRCADRVVTTTTSQAAAILAEPAAYGLSRLVAERDMPPVGIRYGVDGSIWNPATDGLIAARYDAVDLLGKVRCKAALQSSTHLPLREEIPLIAIVLPKSPSVYRQAVHDVLPDLLRNDVQVILSHLAEAADADFFKTLTEQYSERLAVTGCVTKPELHRLLAGADFLMVPPGLGPTKLHLCALRYGTVPIVPAEASLAENIVDCDARLETGTGFIFDTAEAAVLLATCQRAAGAFAHNFAFQRLQKHIMQIDHSWDRAARYVDQMAREVVIQPKALT
jgi:starch synthase